jgi:iron complex transport system substrate-binding protein
MGGPRVVSMVPSWTETLLECGVAVVGRTRFCIHPHARVATIPRMGGTKEWKLDKVLGAAPDLVVLDREENPRAMAAEAPCPVLATHVRAAADVAPEVERLAGAIGGAAGERLRAMAERWRRALDGPPAALPEDWERLPGLQRWIRKPDFPPARLRAVEYLIWRDPWMGVAPATFIGSMLARAGFAGRLPERAEPYPRLDASQWHEAEGTVLLCSSEPFPFERCAEEIAALGTPAALVDGEAWSWFGLRSLRFLEGLRGTSG